MSRIFRPFFLTGLVSVLLLTGLGCKGVSPEVVEATRPITINFWGVFDDSDAFTDIIKNYNVLQPHVTIRYRKFRAEEYEEELINAFAEDRGPDIYMVHNTWVHGYESKILPLPNSLLLPVRELRGTVKKEIEISLRRIPTKSIRQLQSEFVDVVTDDVVIQTEEITPGGGRQTVSRIYGLPLFVDTLALFSNKALLNRAGIAEPPRNWQEVQNAAKNTKITLFDANQNIVQSAIALGTSENVERSVDIVQLLMMQNRTQMTSADGSRASFSLRPRNYTGGDLNPGTEATVFYTDFANPIKEVYTWNSSMPNSLEAFVGGQSAMFVGYSYHTPLIRARAPKLSFAISSIPQIGDETNFASYWINTVSKKTKHVDETWDFIQFMTSAEQARLYLEKTQKPTALRSLISTQLEDLNLGVFAEQTLTAKSWYHGDNTSAMERSFKDMITNVLSETEKPQKWVEIAAQQVNQTLGR